MSKRKPPVLPKDFKRRYAIFLNLYNHRFGRKSSRYRKDAKVWLRSLKKGDKYYKCETCRNTRWSCDQNQLRCQSCIDRHRTCPRTGYFKRWIIMNKLGLSEEEYDELEEQVPNQRGRPAKRLVTPSDNGDDSEDYHEPDTDKESRQPEDDSEDEPVASSSKTIPATPSSSCSTPIRMPRRSKRIYRAASRPQIFDSESQVSNATLPFTCGHDERILEEMTSVRSLLEQMDTRMKSGFATLLRFSPGQENKENKPPSNTTEPGSQSKRPGISSDRVPLSCPPRFERDPQTIPGDYYAVLSPIPLRPNSDDDDFGVPADAQHLGDTMLHYPGDGSDGTQHRSPLSPTVNNSRQV